MACCPACIVVFGAAVPYIGTVKISRLLSSFFNKNTGKNAYLYTTNNPPWTIDPLSISDYMFTKYKEKNKVKKKSGKIAHSLDNFF